MRSMILIPKTSNAKTGDIAVSYSPEDSCPSACPFKEGGCYAKVGPTKLQWDRCKDKNDSRYIDTCGKFIAVLTKALCNENKPMFRHNVAGDMAEGPKGNEWFSRTALNDLVVSLGHVEEAIGKKIVSWTYTHCDLDREDIMRIQDASGTFLVNRSCETIEEVSFYKDQGINCVLTSSNVQESIEALRKEGYRGVQCPAQTKGITCKQCGLCAKDRESVIIFAPHGAGAKKVIRILEEKKHS